MRQLLALRPLVFVALGAAVTLDAQTADYAAVSDNRGEFVNLNVEPVRPMHLRADGVPGTPDAIRDFWAVNNHASQVKKFDLLGDDVPQTTYDTLLHPTAVTNVGDELWVVCGGTHAVAVHDYGTGDIVQVIPLPSEPADIVVDPLGAFAYVSCQGADVVVQINTTTKRIAVEYPIPAERPRFLTYDHRNTPGLHDDIVYVAPMLSGNNTTVSEQPGGNDVHEVVMLDLRDSNVVTSGGLPDIDLFRIQVGAIGPGGVPTTSDPADQVFPAYTGISTILTDHGPHPYTGQYWMLGVESHNQLEFPVGHQVSSEPELRGRFATNELVVMPAPTNNVQSPPPGAGNETPQYVQQDLEDASFPYSLAFHWTGYAVIASSTGDNLAVHKPNGDPFLLGGQPFQIPLPEGAIPRQVEFFPAYRDWMFVYCWGTNQILVYRIPTLEILGIETVGYDPTPDVIAKGRELWYDASNSEGALVSCNHCHVAGGSDLLAWPLENRPVDRKNFMVTQSLLGIEDTAPYHWRGEQFDLRAFNDAFVGLMGSDATLSEGDFDAFEAFVFSLQGSANPLARLDRTLDDADVVPVVMYDPANPDGTQDNVLLANPAHGQFLFTDQHTDNGQTCASCHLLPTGSNNDFLNNPASVPTNANREVPHLREMIDRQNRVTSIQVHADAVVPDGTGVLDVLTPVGGYGFAHSGAKADMVDFIRFFQDRTLANEDPDLTDKDVADLVAFMFLFDEGISPAAHFAKYVAASTTENAAVWDDIENVLLPQAASDKLWIDLVGIGRWLDGGVLRRARWWYDAENDVFVPDVPTIGPKTFAQIKAKVQAGEAWGTFCGVPPGMGHGFGVDFDRDGLVNGAEASELVLNSSPANPDTDGDGFYDGFEELVGSNPLSSGSVPFASVPQLVSIERLHQTTRLVTYRIETHIPSRVRLTLEDTGHNVEIVRETFELQHVDTISVHKLRASKDDIPNPGAEWPQHDYTIKRLELMSFDGIWHQVPVTSIPPETAFRTTSSGLRSNSPVNTIIGDVEVVCTEPIGSFLKGVVKFRVDSYLSDSPSFPLPRQAVIAQVLVEDIQDRVPEDWIVAEVATPQNPMPMHPLVTDHPTDFSLYEVSDDGVGNPVYSTPESYAANQTTIIGSLLVSDPTLGVNETLPLPYCSEVLVRGETHIEFTVGNLTGSERVKVAVFGILPEPQSYDDSFADGEIAPVLLDGATFENVIPLYLVAGTLPENRNIELNANGPCSCAAD